MRLLRLVFASASMGAIVGGIVAHLISRPKPKAMPTPAQRQRRPLPITWTDAGHRDRRRAKPLVQLAAMLVITGAVAAGGFAFHIGGTPAWQFPGGTAPLAVRGLQVGNLDCSADGRYGDQVKADDAALLGDFLAGGSAVLPAPPQPSHGCPTIGQDVSLFHAWTGTEFASITWGDLNCDGEVNEDDLIYLNDFIDVLAAYDEALASGVGKAQAITDRYAFSCVLGGVVGLSGSPAAGVQLLMGAPFTGALGWQQEVNLTGGW